MITKKIRSDHLWKMLLSVKSTSSPNLQTLILKNNMLINIQVYSLWVDIRWIKYILIFILFFLLKYVLWEERIMWLRKMYFKQLKVALDNLSGFFSDLGIWIPYFWVSHLATLMLTQSRKFSLTHVCGSWKTLLLLRIIFSLQFRFGALEWELKGAQPTLLPPSTEIFSGSANNQILHVESHFTRTSLVILLLLLRLQLL